MCGVTLLPYIMRCRFMFLPSMFRFTPPHTYAMQGTTNSFHGHTSSLTHVTPRPWKISSLGYSRVGKRLLQPCPASRARTRVLHWVRDRERIYSIRLGDMLDSCWCMYIESGKFPRGRVVRGRGS
jgi:hypothetical protein